MEVLKFSIEKFGVYHRVELSGSAFEVYEADCWISENTMRAQADINLKAHIVGIYYIMNDEEVTKIKLRFG